MPDPEPDTLRRVRRAVLANRYARQGCAQTAETILASLRMDDRSITSEQVDAAIDYLSKKGWLSSVPDALAHGVKYWDIAAAGIDAHES